MKGFKWHWGWSILTVFVAFVVIFLYVFYLSIKELRTNELTVEDYYTAELQYGEVLDQKYRADTMRVPVKIRVDTQSLRIEFPTYWPPERVKGTLVLYRPNKQLFDRTVPFVAGEHHYIEVPRDSLLPGRWDIRLKWWVDSLPYYLEEKLWLD